MAKFKIINKKNMLLSLINLNILMYSINFNFFFLELISNHGIW